MTQRLGSIEAGGTKFILAVSDMDLAIRHTIRIRTTTPAETVSACVAFFTKHPVDALGVGSFGPIDPNPNSRTYGQILSTPKPGWAHFNIVGELTDALRIPIFFTTDVNASIYGEHTRGAAQNLNAAVYFTIGTGIGGGALQNGQFIGGRSHAEMGHTGVIKHPDDNFDGNCPYHGDRCFEGLASGPAIKARTGQAGETLRRDHEVFDFISYYIAQLCYNTYLNLMPEKIILGGSVVSAAELPAIRAYIKQLNNDYVSLPDDLIAMTSFANNESATFGNLALAKRLLDDHKNSNSLQI